MSVPSKAAINCAYESGNTMSTATIDGATRGDDHIRSMSVIAIVGTVRNTAIKGAKKRRTP